MKLLVLVLVLCLSSARGLIDCRTACRSCRAAEEPPELLNVHCAMCHECKARRRERLAANQKTAPTATSLRTRPPAPWQQYPGYIAEDPRYITEARKYISEAPRYLPAESNSFNQNSRALRQNEAPAGCPQPPVCPDDTVLETLPPCVMPPPPPSPPPPPTTTTTTPAPATCPPVTECVKRTQPRPCCMPMMPCFMTPCPSNEITTASSQRFIDVFVGIPTDAKLRRKMNLRNGEAVLVSKIFNTRLRQHNVLNDRK